MRVGQNGATHPLLYLITQITCVGTTIRMMFGQPYIGGHTPLGYHRQQILVFALDTPPDPHAILIYVMQWGVAKW